MNSPLHSGIICFWDVNEKGGWEEGFKLVELTDELDEGFGKHIARVRCEEVADGEHGVEDCDEQDDGRLLHEGLAMETRQPVVPQRHQQLMAVRVHHELSSKAEKRLMGWSATPFRVQCPQQNP